MSRPQAYPTPSPRAPGSPVLWRARAITATPPAAADAAQGRYWGLMALRAGKLGAVPQRGATGPGVVAWHRASEAQPGYLNRRARKARRHSPSAPLP